MAVDRIPVAPETLTVGVTAMLSRAVVVQVTNVAVGAQQVVVQGTVQGSEADTGQAVTVRLPKGAPTLASTNRSWLLQTRPPAGSCRLLADGSVWVILTGGGGTCVKSGTVHSETEAVISFVDLGDLGTPYPPA